MKAYNSREIINILEEDGWFLIGVHGSHHYFKHSKKPGKVTVPHPRSSFPPKTQKSILKSAGL
ncbi:type II toxin-antitoxin system HicA family toxin [Paenibacillus sp. FSL R10-2796]|uniref:type II toxin-antitoxin system HicA family toxin n=1 Tax=Paenibacillus sp. FSL R10-2796 TaxID=2954663 RepID=UPI0030D6D7DC